MAEIFLAGTQITPSETECTVLKAYLLNDTNSFR